MRPYAHMNNKSQLSGIKFYFKGQEIQVCWLRVQRLEDAAEKKVLSLLQPEMMPTEIVYICPSLQDTDYYFLQEQQNVSR